jgi:hypothetical protein
MKLFYISNRDCQDIKTITKGVKRAYQLEQEFYPYLSVEFLPSAKYKEGIYFVIGDNVIHKDYYLYHKKDLIDLRNTIWSLFPSYYDVTDITKDGCITDFRKLGKNKVTIGWPNIIANGKNNKIKIPDSMLIKQDIKVDEQISKNILHPVYKNSGADIQDRKLCMINRIKECTDNYPVDSQLYKLCNDNVVWLCKNGYPYNIRTKVMNSIVKKQIEDSLKYLKNNDMKVDKPHFDDMMLSGFFERPANRMGNKYTSANPNDKHAINFIGDKSNEYDYYSQVIEGFDNKNKNHYILIFAVIIIIIFIVYFLHKKSNV